MQPKGQSQTRSICGRPKKWVDARLAQGHKPT